MTKEQWRKSSFSGTGQGGCVEVAHDLAALRDSKDIPGPILAGNVRALVASIQRGQLIRPS